MIMKIIFKLWIVTLCAVLAVSCEKEPKPEPQPEQNSDVVPSEDYREKWAGKYWPIGGGYHRVYMTIVENSDSMMHVENTSDHKCDVDVKVNTNGAFYYQGDDDDSVSVNGYFWIFDSLYIELSYLQQTQGQQTARVNKSWNCIKVPDYVPDPE